MKKAELVRFEKNLEKYNNSIYIRNTSEIEKLLKIEIKQLKMGNCKY